MVFLLLSHHVYLCVCVFLCGKQCEGARVCTQQIDFLWPHNQFIYLLHYSAPMSSSVPWRVRTFKGNFDKNTPPPTPTAYICSWYIFSFCPSFLSTHLQYFIKVGTSTSPHSYTFPVIFPQLIFSFQMCTWKCMMNIFLFSVKTYRVKSSSSSLFCRVCLGWVMFAQLGRDCSRRLMSSSLDQEALMVSFSSHWTTALRTNERTQFNADKTTRRCLCSLMMHVGNALHLITLRYGGKWILFLISQLYYLLTLWFFSILFLCLNIYFK